MASDTKRDKGPLPFYELPPHIKPCSQIIHETRLQLKHTKIGGSGSDLDLRPITPLPLGQSGQSASGDLSDYFVDRGGPPLDMVNGTGRRGGHGQVSSGIHAVHTKRPFTPRDSVNFWGLSAQKRPPSAITLSRLSLDDYDGSNYSGKLGNRKKSPLPRHDLSAYNRCESLDSAVSGHNQTKRNGQDDESSLSKTRVRSLATGQNGGGDGVNNKMDGGRAEYFEQINSIEAASDWLMTFLQAPEKIDKMELLGILKRVREVIQATTPQETQKTSLTKLIFKVVEKNPNDEDLLFWSSFILLHCQIIGNNLTTVFKMVFKASRSQTYWGVIKESEYLDVFIYSLGEICPLTQTESMIYGYGTLKFLCMDEYVLVRVLELNLIGVMCLHLKILNCQIAQTNRVPANIQNGLFQLTSILRSVVGVESAQDVVADSGLLQEICNSLQWAYEDFDVISNISRILSVTSSNLRCCETLACNEKLSCAVVKILKMWHSKDSIVVRITYCLGNLLGSYNDFRIKLYQEPLALEMIIQVIGYYMEHFTSSSEDILIKSIRILANWSLCPAIGRDLCEVERLSEMLNSLLDAAEVSNELLLCTMSTLNNLSFHKDHTKSDTFHIKTAESMYNYLTMKDIDVRTEAMKVLGNLTRNSAVCEAAGPFVGPMILCLVEQDNPELLCATIGVLMNIILDERSKVEFARKGGIEYLISLMEHVDDVALNLMLCQLLWNFLVSDIVVDDTGNPQCQNFEPEEMDRAANRIASRIEKVETSLRQLQNTDENKNKSYASAHDDEECVHDEGSSSVYFQICHEYISVANNLHDRLRSLVDPGQQ